MAEQKDKGQPSADSYLAVGDFQTFAAEYEEDRRTMKWAIGLAILLHVILAAVRLPEIVADTRKAEKQKVYVVQQVRFKPPPPQQAQEIPKPRAKKVPIPDPTPDEPEPIRLPDEIQPDVRMPDSDVIFGIPEGPPPVEPTGPIRVGGDVKPPVKITAPPPQYTEIARNARIQGVVIVEAIIDKDGSVSNVKVLKGLPMGLDQAAVDAVRVWRFQPATLNGKPVAVIYNLTINFQLQ